ncbi:cytochrome b5 reductase family protein [Aspergillus homomorphus CBS 101889]|uniref:Oxidoreductase, FAD-binding family protein n=1 Tax=Aspergillus homomorphus (strain CBS 101889) TaxID=1450537 RepID=A0A395HJ00_ASPHC|nr:oxidoreductase, FAD-binding family protein [Aspergillus homomorphus CBS 101889]RAL07750.1 oxidoreductase, FAD-binding family protein [Aspergillus homomorphus CBS 101889]
MKSRLSCQNFRRYNAPSIVGRQPSSPSPPSPSPSPPPPPPKSRRWVQLVLITAAAGGIGAYIRSEQGSRSSTLTPTQFTPYYLVSREPVSSSGSIFTLQPPKVDGSNHAVYEKAWTTGIWSVMFKQPQLQIGRDYTPLPLTSPEEEEDECLRFFIRRDPHGEVSRYLHSLDIGSPIEVRGPRSECGIPPDTQQILFIAGGTGIAPALQAAHSLLRRTDQTRKPRIHILWANRKRDDCVGGVSDTVVAPSPQRSWLFGRSAASTASSAPVAPIPRESRSLIVRELEALQAQYPGQMTVDYFVDEEGNAIGKQAILSFTNTTESSSRNPGQENLILVSGPEGFISHMAGPKLWAEGMELQGPLRGIIKELNLKDWAVWKL